MKDIIIPGSGWDIESVFSSFIKIRGRETRERSIEIIKTFEFDDLYPFTDISSVVPVASFGFQVIGFCGSYKQKGALDESIGVFNQTVPRWKNIS